MKCAYNPRLDYDIDLDDLEIPITCENEATHDRECTQSASPVCIDHTCRHSVTLKNAEDKKERLNIPSFWMAL
jgi:hypothetical protein